MRFSRAARTIPRSQRAKKGPSSVFAFKNLFGRNYSTADKEEKRKKRKKKKKNHELKLLRKKR